MDIIPSPQQDQAISRISDPGQWQRQHMFAWLAGYAGSGKTSIAPHIIERYGARRPLFVAPTNKAARVLTSKGLPAISIHKAIYHPPGEHDPKQIRELKQQIAAASDPEEKAALESRLENLEDSLAGETELTWRLNPEGAAAQADLILCDEASMVGTRLGQDLVSFGVPIIAIGDPGQLPPVKDTPFFCTGEPDFLLSEIHRQAADNPIIRLSQDIRQGKPLRPGRMGDQVHIAHRGSVEVPNTPEAMPQVIVGTHRRRWIITDAMRATMGFCGKYPNPGEKLVCRKNSLGHEALINGAEVDAVSFEDFGDDHVILASVDAEGERIDCRAWTGPFREHATRDAVRPRMKSDDLVAKVNNECVDFGWAITCHVSQGSQWDDVLVYDESMVFRDDARKWLYTACTRSTDRLTIMI